MSSEQGNRAGNVARKHAHGLGLSEVHVEELPESEMWSQLRLQRDVPRRHRVEEPRQPARPTLSVVIDLARAEGGDELLIELETVDYLEGERRLVRHSPFPMRGTRKQREKYGRAIPAARSSVKLSTP